MDWIHDDGDTMPRRDRTARGDFPSRDRMQASARAGARQAEERIRGMAEPYSRRGAAYLDTVASALRAAAHRFEERNQAQAAQAARQAGSRVQRLGERLEAGDFSEIAHDVRGFARANTGLFVAGCVFAGLAAARFLRAAEPESPRSTRALPPRRAARAPEPSAHVRTDPYIQPSRVRTTDDVIVDIHRPARPYS